jgi:hypothetical protein
MLCRAALSLSLLLAAQALGASALEASRVAATHAHDQVSALTHAQTDRRAELDALSQTIETLKAKRQHTAGGELEADLRRSQALSDQLATLSKNLADASREAQAADLALLSSLNTALADQQRAWSPADKASRLRTLEAIRSLRAERETVRARLPRSALPSLVAAQTDDPTVLLEQADALRDSEDKVRRKLAELDGRIAQARNERELDRRMNELANDDSLFDEQDRQLRLSRAPDGVLSVDAPAGTPRAASATGPAVPATGPEDGPLTYGGQPGGLNAHASDHQPQLGEPGASLPLGDGLSSLEQERARLSQLAGALEAKARAAEEKARAQP